MPDRLPPELGQQVEEDIRNKNSPETLLRELAKLGVKHAPENVVRIARKRSGGIVFLETGD
ncbi:hypothetical protein [Neosynechococcus sphagnicola]|uniref:hypothetical protein n=1 Tax=Neosynechococcus sphagnicola TaxID=1501145 RepID=UPI00068DE52F|nr:hypothetical protein [Neosynechococcus sphagnicola]